MRGYIFTERERRLLRDWIEEGEETQETRKVLSWIRRGFPLLAEDMSLMFETIRAMQRRHRWWGGRGSRAAASSAQHYGAQSPH